jgi:hypothetical protein
MLVSYTWIFVINHAEQAPEEPLEPAQVNGVNTEQDQGKPRCIEPPPLSLCYPFYILIMILGCALGYMSRIGTLVALLELYVLLLLEIRR